MRLKKQLPLLLGALTVCLLMAEPSFAAATGSPWERPLTVILNSITGPVAQVIGAVLVIVTGIGICMSEAGSSAKKALFCVLGLSVTFTATSYMLGFLGYTAGVGL